MKDTELYAVLLKLHRPWQVREDKLDLAAECVDVWLEHGQGMKCCLITQIESNVVQLVAALFPESQCGHTSHPWRIV